MALSFPYLGSFTYVFESIARGMKRDDIIVPNPPNNKTKQLGSRYSSEFVCTPFKMMLGSIIEVLEQGAYEIVATVFVDYCRLGYYYPLFQIILEDLGYDFELLTLDWFKKVDFFRGFKKIARNVNAAQAFQAFRIGWIKNRYIDLIDELQYSYGAVEVKKNTAHKVAQKLYRNVVETEGMKNVRMLPQTIRQTFEEKVDIHKNRNPLKVAIVGELYAVVEPSINLDLMRRLNEIGVIAYTPITFTRWIDLGQKLNPFKKWHHNTCIKYAKPYVRYPLGGKTRESLGAVVEFKEMGWDGVIHLYPFTCMPEIISRSILPQVSREHDMPVLSLVLDEHTGETGLQTRLEAFIDLLKRKRNKDY